MNSTLSLLVATGGIIVAVCAAAQLPGEGERFPASTPVSLPKMLRMAPISGGSPAGVEVACGLF